MDAEELASYNFCDTEIIDIDRLASQIASNVFGCPYEGRMSGLLAERYRQMAANFSGKVPHDSSDWDLKAFGDSFICKNVGDDECDARLKITREYLTREEHFDTVDQLFTQNNFGHDLPIWICKDYVEPRFRVAIVAQDPLRANDEKGSLYLGTPFGLHSFDYLKKRCRNSAAYEIITGILSLPGVCVYLTDASKLYTYKELKGGRNIKLNGVRGCGNYKKFKNSFNTMFGLEMDEFRPDLIVTLGNMPVSSLQYFKQRHINGPACGFEVQNLLEAIKHYRSMVISAYHPNCREKSVERFHSTKKEYFSNVLEKIAHVSAGMDIDDEVECEICHKRCQCYQLRNWLSGFKDVMGGYVCDKCLGASCFQCEDCGQYYGWDDCKYGGGKMFCPVCAAMHLDDKDL